MGLVASNAAPFDTSTMVVKRTRRVKRGRIIVD